MNNAALNVGLMKALELPSIASLPSISFPNSRMRGPRSGNALPRVDHRPLGSNPHERQAAVPPIERSVSEGPKWRFAGHTESRWTLTLQYESALFSSVQFSYCLEAIRNAALPDSIYP